MGGTERITRKEFLERVGVFSFAFFSMNFPFPDFPSGENPAPQEEENSDYEKFLEILSQIAQEKGLCFYGLKEKIRDENLDFLGLIEYIENQQQKGKKSDFLTIINFISQREEPKKTIPPEAKVVSPRVYDFYGDTQKWLAKLPDLRSSLPAYQSLFSEDLILWALAIKISESGKGFPAYISTGGDTDISSVVPRVVSKRNQLSALEEIERGVGSFYTPQGSPQEQEAKGKEALLEAASKLGWGGSEIPCSSEMAIGPFQFLPTTWKSCVEYCESLFPSWEQKNAFFKVLFNAGLLRREGITSFWQLNPFDFSEALLVALFYFKKTGMKPDGTNFLSAWNASSSHLQVVRGLFSDLKQKYSRGELAKEGFVSIAGNNSGERQVGAVEVSEKELPLVKSLGSFFPQYDYLAQRETNPPSSWGLHNLSYKEPKTNEDPYLILWRGQDFQGQNRKEGWSEEKRTVSAPCEGVIVAAYLLSNRPDLGGYVDIEFRMKVGEEYLRARMRIHHLAEATISAIRERLSEEGGIRVEKEEVIGNVKPGQAHIHVGFAIEKRGTWYSVPASFFINGRETRRTTYTVPGYTDSVVFSDEETKSNLRSLGLLNQN